MSEEDVLILNYVLKEFWHDFDFEEVYDIRYMNVAGSKRIETNTSFFPWGKGMWCIKGVKCGELV